MLLAVAAEFFECFSVVSTGTVENFRKGIFFFPPQYGILPIPTHQPAFPYHITANNQGR